DSAPGEKRETVESYSTNLPGTVGDGGLHLNQRVKTVRRVRPDGKQSAEEQVAKRNPAEPGAPLRLTQKTIDIVRAVTAGENEATRTLQSMDSNGDLNVVSVDMRKSDKIPAIQVDISTPTKHK